MPITAAELVARVVADTGQAESQLRGFASRMGGSGGPLGSLSTTMAGVFGGTLLAGGLSAAGRGLSNLARGGVGLFVDMASAGADFEMQMDAVAAVLGGTQKEAEALGDLALSLAMNEDLKVNATEAATAIQNLATAGLSAEEILGGAAEASVLLANSTGGELGQAATVATDVMSLFNIEAGNMGEAINGIAAVANVSKFDLQDYALATAQAGGVAAMSGVDFEDFNAVIAATAPAFNSGGDAGTSFKTFLQRLQPTTKEAASLMGELGLLTDEGASVFYDATGSLKGFDEIAGILNTTFGEMTEAQKQLYGGQIFGTDAIRTMGELSKFTREEFQAFMAEMAKTDALESAKVRTDNFASSLEAFQGKIEGLKLGVWSKLEPAAQAVMDALMPAVDWAAPYLTGWAEQFGSWVQTQIPIVKAKAAEVQAAFSSAFTVSQAEGDAWGVSMFQGIAAGAKELLGAESYIATFTAALAPMQEAMNTFGAGTEGKFASSLLGFAAAVTGGATSFDEATQTFTAKWKAFQVTVNEMGLEGFTAGALNVNFQEGTVTVGGQPFGTWLSTKMHTQPLLEGGEGLGVWQMGALKIDFQADTATVNGKPLGEAISGLIGADTIDVPASLDKMVLNLVSQFQNKPVKMDIEPKVNWGTTWEDKRQVIVDVVMGENAITPEKLSEQLTEGTTLWGEQLPEITVPLAFDTEASGLNELVESITGQEIEVPVTLGTPDASALDPLFNLALDGVDISTRALEPEWGEFTNTYDVSATVAAHPAWGNYTNTYGVGAAVTTAPDWGSWTWVYTAAAKITSWINGLTGPITIPGVVSINQTIGGGFGTQQGPTSSPLQGGISGFGPVGGNATGNPLFPGGWTWVGERGPELVRLPRASRIFDDQESRGMVGGRAVTINATVRDGIDIEVLANRVKRLILQGA